MVLAELGGKLRDSIKKLQTNSDGIDAAALNTLLGEISRALIESDVNVSLVMKLRDNVKSRVGGAIQKAEESSSTSGNQNIARLVQKSVVDELTALLTPENTKAYKMKKNKPNVVLFVGLQGAGKTTSIAKFANYYQRKGWKTCMVCADTFRAGAFDQLKQNATKLRIPFYGSYTEADPVAIAEDGVGQFIADGFEVIIVDTSGRHKQEGALFEEMQEISSAVNPDNTVFVMDATQGQAVYDQAQGFREAVDVGSVIVTKLDGHAKGGGALSAVSATKSPIIFLGSGEKFDDFELFNAQSFVSKLLGFGDTRGILQEMKDVHGSDTQKELMAKMQKGQFTLRDMYKQFQQVLKMGPMNKAMGMTPGMPEYLIPQSGDEESNRRLKKFMYMMDSMTDAELDGKVDMHNKKGDDDTIESRIKRIAKGSGTHPTEVKMMLQCHKQFEGMVSKMGKSGMLKGKNVAQQKQLMESMKKNPNAAFNQLNRMNPQMVKQMGGRDAVMKMMQGGGIPGMPGAGGGMPDMASMAKMMGGGGGAMPGGGGGMPDMAAMAKMMGGGGGGAGGGMPDMATMAKMMQGMGGQR